MLKRKQYHPEFKAKVVLEALKGDSNPLRPARQPTVSCNAIDHTA